MMAHYFPFFRQIGAASLACAAIACSAPPSEAGAPEILVGPRLMGGDEFVDRFGAQDRRRWSVSHGWANGPSMINDWQRTQVSYADRLTLVLAERQGAAHRYSSGEVQSRATYGHGYFETTMRAARGNGIVTGFFTYTGPPFGQPWNEIDVEILGAEPTTLYATYFYLGDRVSQTIELGFDATQRTHHYAFDWQPGSIRWFVDGILVHEVDGSDLPLPNVQQKLMVHLWGTETLHRWAGRFDPIVLPVTAEFACIAYSREKPARSRC